MEKELNKLQQITKVSPPDYLGDKIWKEIVRRKVETISWYKVAAAACFVGGLLLSSIYVSTSSQKSDSVKIANEFQLTNSYNIYHE